MPSLGGVELWTGPRRNLSCNAVAIAPHFLLTAAHCCVGKVSVVPSPTDNHYLSRTDEQMATCTKAPPSAGVWDEAVEHIRSDLALIRVPEPLPMYMVPAKRLPATELVKGVPLIPPDTISVRRLFRRAPSKVLLHLAQYVPDGRFEGADRRAMVAPMPIVGFAEVFNSVIFAPPADDIVGTGTSGAGVFVEEESGMRLLGITHGVLTENGEVLALAVDVRSYEAWIDAEMAKAP